MIKFSYTGLFRVYQEEDGKWEFETVEEGHVSLPLNVDVGEEMSIFVSDLEFPKTEGIYTVWAVGQITYSCDYFGEWDMDIEPTILEISLAGNGDTDMANSIIESWSNPVKHEMVPFSID